MEAHRGHYRYDDKFVSINARRIDLELENVEVWMHDYDPWLISNNDPIDLWTYKSEKVEV